MAGGPDSRVFEGSIVAVLVCTLIAVLYGSVMGLWWTYDDFFNLHQVLTRPAEHYLLDRRVWREMPNRLFTPLQMLSYEVDVRSFGLRPRPFYVHQLLSFAAATVAFYFLLRSWFSSLSSVAATCFFVAGMPVNSWVQQLMVRHYVEGLLFAILATVFFVLAQRRRSLVAASAAALAYFCAAASKEIYVPLPFLLLLLPDSPAREKLRYIAPQLAAFAIYLSWRFAMLGTVVGGYGWAIRRSEIPGLLAALPMKLLRAMSPPGVIGWYLTAIIVALLAWTVMKRRRLLFVVGAAALLLFPLLPVSRVFEARFAALPWLFIAGAFGFAVQEIANLRGTHVAAAVFVIIVGFVIVSNRIGWRGSFRSAQRMSVEARFLAEARDPVLLRHPRVPPAALAELRWLKQEHLQSRNETSWFYDDLFLCDHQSAARIWQYDDRSGRIISISERVPGLRERYCRSIRWSAPLEARFKKDNGNLFWTLGPYERGSYALLLADGASLYEVPRREGFQIGGLDVLPLRVRYTSPDGWVTFSPELPLDFESSATFEWRR